METSAPDVVNGGAADVAAEAEAGRTEVRTIVESFAERVGGLQSSGWDERRSTFSYERTFADYSPDDVRVAARSQAFLRVP